MSGMSSTGNALDICIGIAVLLVVLLGGAVSVALYLKLVATHNHYHHLMAAYSQLHKANDELTKRMGQLRDPNKDKFDSELGRLWVEYHQADEQLFAAIRKVR